MVIKAQLFTKSLGQSCAGARFKGFHAPKTAKTFDSVTGIGKKGRFEITSFRREDGSLMKRVSRYLDDAGNETLTIKNWTEGWIHQVTAINRKVTESVSDIINVAEDKKSVAIFRNRLLNTENGTRDFHSIGFYRQGRAPREISFEAKWDGNVPDVHYKNIKTRLPDRGLEYLPLITSESAMPRYQHVARVQLKEYGLEDCVPDLKLVDVSELNCGCKSIEEAKNKLGVVTVGITTCIPPSGQVFIVNSLTSSEEVISTIAHEYAHVSYLSRFVRLKFNADIVNSYSPETVEIMKKEMPEAYNFMRKSVDKGVITKENSKDYEYWHLKHLAKKLDINKYHKQVKTQEQHDHHPLEVGPIRKAKEEVEKFKSLLDSVIKVLNND